MLLLQLAYSLKEIPTVEICELNTDAIMYMVDEEYVEQSHKVLEDWQKLTQLELEQDKIKKLVMRDVNNYVEITNPGDNYYEVHYKGGLFTGEHKFDWDKENKVFHYSFKDDLKSNSLTICAEAIIKELLFNIPCEETINKCNDTFRFQMISHLGGTYEKCVIAYPGKEEIELQRNNRIYAGKVKNGAKIYKVKADGRHDSLANCPPNPIVDNDNKVSIEDINKLWYIKYTKQKLSDFKGGNEIYMEEKLDKLKKEELINMVKEMKEREENKMVPIDPLTETHIEWDYHLAEINLAKKINEFRKLVRKRNFILDKSLPTNLGGGEYYSVDQLYQVVQDCALDVGLDFAFNVVDVMRFDLAAFKPATGAPQNIATVKCIATFTDIESGARKDYCIVSQGSDSIDKAVNSASSYAFRNWFDKNFTPKYINGEEIKFGEDNDFSVDNVTRETIESKPKTPVYVTPEKKEEIVKTITETPQKSDDNKSDIDEIVSLIYEYRELSKNDKAGEKTLQSLMNNEFTNVQILNCKLSFQNAIEDLKRGA